jgi:hypothetical protein
MSSSQWHLNHDTIGSAEPWALWCRWTRTAPPDITGYTNTDQIANYTPDEKLFDSAVHEAAHAVLYLATGHRIRGITIHAAGDDSHGGQAQVDHAPFSGLWLDFVTAAAAGERAQDRWLRESGLWTPGRAWVAERLAWDDRRQVAESTHTCLKQELSFGVRDDWTDYAWIMDRADEALDPLWDRVLTLTHHIAEHRQVTGEEAARITGLSSNDDCPMYSALPETPSTSGKQSLWEIPLSDTSRLVVLDECDLRLAELGHRSAAT